MNENENLNNGTELNTVNNAMETPAMDAPTAPAMETPAANTVQATNDGNNLVRFLLTFFLGAIGSFIINHTSLKPAGFKSRTAAYFFLSLVTFGIYPLVASICNFTFDPNKEKISVIKRKYNKKPLMWFF